ncbi:MAG: hypothetical protein JWO36_6350, partial [Myxococcales bacterium]|nr:hypothetical protein [Myxococcales bacterium]
VAEREVVELEAALSNPEVFKDRSKDVQAMISKLDAARANVEKMFARWQELEAIAKASPS